MAGNVYEWSGEVLATTPNMEGYYDAAGAYTNVQWAEPSQARGLGFGYGYRGLSGDPNVVFLRGGDDGSSGFGSAGVFEVLASNGPAVSNNFIGFRCVYVP